MSGGSSWDSTNKWIVVPTGELPASTSPFYPHAGQFITATQIGNPPQWADRWSSVGGQSSSSAFTMNDLVSFYGSTNTGSFSQQIAIAVDQVSDQYGNILPSGSTGEIYKWHFVWGGQYTALPDATMAVDTANSYIAAGNTGAIANFTPAWSGWSVMDENSAISPGGGYSPGATVSFNFSGGTPNQGHYPTIVVMSVNGTGGITGWLWLDYGSYPGIPSALATPLTQSSASCSPSCGGAQLLPEWTRGALATTIASVTTGGSCPSGDTCIVPTDAPSGVPTGQPIENFYYGDDDGAAIQNALNNTVGINSAYTPGSVRVTGYCGTTIPITLPASNNLTAPTSAPLIGDAYKTAGLFAFAWDLADRGMNGDAPLLNHVVETAQGKSFGGGLRDLENRGWRRYAGLRLLRPVYEQMVATNGL